MSLFLFSASAPAQTASPQSPVEVELASLEWPPYIGASLPQQGHIHQIVREALARRGLNLKVRYRPWARALALARQGEVIGLFPEYHDATREGDFAYSLPLPGGAVGFYKRRDADIEFSTDPRIDPDGAFRDLRAYRFGVVRGYVNNMTFDAADYLQRDLANSDELNLKKLAYGRVDLIFIDDLVAQYLLRTRLPEYAPQLEFMQPALEYKPLYIGFSRQHPQHDQVRKAFNLGLDSMREDGRLQAILRQHGINFQP